jgi:hypothetical protein
MWCIQAVVCHVINSNCFLPCDTCGKNLLVIIILLRGYGQSQFLSLSGTTITVPRYFAMWCIQTVRCHVIPSSWLIACDTFKLCYAMWYPQTLLYNVISSNTFNLFYSMWCIQTAVYHVIPSNCFIPSDAFKLSFTMWYLQADLYHVIHWNFAMPCDTLKLFNTMWYLQIVHTLWYLQQTDFIPCNTFNLFFIMWYL